MYARMVICHYVFKSLYVIVNVMIHEYTFIYRVVLIRKLINKHHFNKYNRIMSTPPILNFPSRLLRICIKNFFTDMVSIIIHAAKN
jgi:hypothetical protein